MKPSLFRYEIPLLLVVAGAGAGATWMTANRLEGFNFVSRSYQDVYEFTSTAIVQGFDSSEPGRLGVHIVSGRKSGRAQGAEAKESIKLTEGQNAQFFGETRPGQKPAFWTMWGQNINPVVIGNVEAPIGPPAFELDDFVAHPSAFQASQVTEAQRIAIEEFGIQETSSSIPKLRALAIGLHTQLYPHRGDPTPAMRNFNGWQQYKEAIDGNSGIYCENHAEIFAFFANAIGIPTRVVGAAGMFDGVALGAHAFTESYIRETGRWMYIDLQLNIFSVADEVAGPLNAADFVHRMASGSASTLQLEMLRNGALANSTFSEHAEEIGMFLHPKVTLVYLWGLADRYSTLERLKRFFLTPQPGYSLRSIGVGTELRLLCTYAFLCLGLLWLTLRFAHMLGRGNPPS